MSILKRHTDRTVNKGLLVPFMVRWAKPAGRVKVIVLIAVLLTVCVATLHARQASMTSTSRGKETGSFAGHREISWYFIYVSPGGSDDNWDQPGYGSKKQPFKTIAMAIRKAREVRRLGQNRCSDGRLQGIQILLEDGVYYPEQTLMIRPEDGGTADAPTRLAAIHQRKATISGGLKISGWKQIDASDPLFKLFSDNAARAVYVAHLPRKYGTDINFRQLWVNGRKAVRAECYNGGSYGNNMRRILSWDHKDQSCWIPRPKGFDVRQATEMEMIIHQWWAIANLRVSSARVAGDSVELHFRAPESRLQSEHPWPAPWLSEKTGNSAFFLANAPGFLDTAAEWYLDRATQKVYYMPRKGEDMATANVMLPYLTTLLKMAGSPEQPVNNFQLQGINFQFSTWLRPSRLGHVPLQAGMFLLEAYKLKQPGTPEKAGLENQAWIGRPPAAVELAFTRNAQVKDCAFRHLASSGLDLVIGTERSLIEGNLLKDIGGTGIQIGTYSPKDYETHLPYRPKNPHLVCRYDTIRNNLVTDVTNEDWGCVGISAGVVQSVVIAHNEVSDVSYSGICVGWGWTKKISALAENQILNNKVTHYAKRMYDVGGLYTLSAQPGTLIQGNCIDSIYKAPYPHDPEHWFYYYLDEGSSYITIKDNWSPALKVMKNANGPGNNWENDGPVVSDSIKNQAGLQPAYQYLLAEKVTDKNWPVQPVPLTDKNKIYEK